MKNQMTLKFSELKAQNPEAAQAFIEEFGRRMTPFVAFLRYEAELHAVWQGEVEVEMSEYDITTKKWSDPVDVWGETFTPEIERALEDAFSW